MLDKEKIIKEQRIAEAISKDLMGLEGKLGTILKYLGQSILVQGSRHYEQNIWENVYELEDADLPVEDPDTPIHEIGKIFDGLKFGHHIEITYLKEGMVPVKNINNETEY